MHWTDIPSGSRWEQKYLAGHCRKDPQPYNRPLVLLHGGVGAQLLPKMSMPRLSLFSAVFLQSVLLCAMIDHHPQIHPLL